MNLNPLSWPVAAKIVALVALAAGAGTAAALVVNSSQGHASPAANIAPSATPDSAPAKAVTREYVACAALGAGCAGSEGMQARPQTLFLSADGSLYLKPITWHGWGTATATGTATAHADDCKPNCAQGTYSTHPATIIFTAPKPWDGKIAYTHVQESVPAIGWHNSLIVRLMPTAPAAPPTTAASLPPAPGPVSTAATVTSSCLMGYIPTAQGAVFQQGTPQGQTIAGTYYPPVPGYQLTITDTSGATADVNGFAVVFYNSNGQELGSGQENVTETFITTGQSLTWSEYSATDTSGNSDSFGTATIPAGATTCGMVAWYGP